jgi:hypothetical protein
MKKNNKNLSAGTPDSQWRADNVCEIITFFSQAECVFSGGICYSREEASSTTHSKNNLTRSYNGKE